MKTYNQFIQELNVLASPGLRQVIKGVEERERLTGGGPAPTAPTRPKPTVDVGTTDDNKNATRIKVQPYQARKGDSYDREQLQQIKDTEWYPDSKKHKPEPGDVYIKRTPGDGLPKIKLDKDGLPIPGQYGVY
tara:strand:+ start:107 stop:505 length:399 start_codon:yes stop_codon:yes gene_type:complete